MWDYSGFITAVSAVAILMGPLLYGVGSLSLSGEYYSTYNTNLFCHNNNTARLYTSTYTISCFLSYLYTFAAGGGFWKVAPYITDQPIVSKRAVTRTNLLDVGSEFGDGRGDEL